MPADALHSALDAYSVPLRPTDEEPPPSFDGAFRGRDVVALGEPVHGTSEFATVTAGLVEHLVEHRGFRTLALEVDAANAIALDRFVRDGVGTPTAALDDLALWVWRTTGVLDLLNRLRQLNHGRDPADAVRVRGVSVGEPSTSAATLCSVLDALDADRFESRAELEALASGDAPAETDRMQRFEAGTDLARTLDDHLHRHRDAFDETAASVEFELATHLCTQLERACDWKRTRLSTPDRFDPDAFAERDRLMAENATWCVGDDPGDGVVLWAHNAHVKRGTFDLPHDWAAGATMGAHLDDALGARYCPIGGTVARGSYRAKSSDSPGGEPERFEVPDPREERLAALLDARYETPRFLAVDDATDDDRLADHLDRETRVPAISALVDPDPDERVHYMRTCVGEAFDELAFVPRVSPAPDVAASHDDS